MLIFASIRVVFGTFLPSPYAALINLINVPERAILYFYKHTHAKYLAI